MMLSIAVPRPPRFDLLLVAIIIASGLAFFAVCADAHASSIVLSDSAPIWTDAIWTDASSLSIGSSATRALHLSGGVAGVGPNAANGGSVTLTANSAGTIPASTIVIAGNTPMRAGAVRIAYAGTDREVVDEDGTHFVGADVDVNGDPVVTLDMLFSALRSTSYFHDARYVTRSEYGDHERELFLSGAILAVGGGVAGAGLATLLGMTLFSSAFSMRRWISRAHRSLEQKKQAQQAATHL